MARSRNVTFDNVGSPDAYVVQTVCRSIRLIEKDRTAGTLATYNVYAPDSTNGSAIPKRGGESWDIAASSFFYPGDRPFQLETVNVASSVFSVEEL